MVQQQNRIEVVIINFRRPDNVRRIVEAFLQQSAPCTITLIDDPAAKEFELDVDTLNVVDHIYLWSGDFGPYSRYVPLAAYSHEFTYFHDDDMLPGSRLIEHLEASADVLGEFGVLGQMGRIVGPDGSYDGKPVRPTDRFEPVDIIVRGSLVRTRNLPAVAQQRLDLGLEIGPGLEDDLVLCTAMGMQRSLDNYLLPKMTDTEFKMCSEELPDTFARQRRSDHHTARTAFCRRAIDAGWKPLALRR